MVKEGTLTSHSHTLVRSGHKIIAVCAVIMMHFNSQYLTIALSFVTIYSISVMDIVQGLGLIYFSPFVDRSRLISVHDITTCMNVDGCRQSSVVKCRVWLRQDL